MSEALGALQEALLEGPGLDFAERDLLRRTGAPASVPEQAAVMAKAAKVASQRAQKKAATARDEATRRKASKLERLLKAIEDFFRGLGDPPTPPKPKPQEA